MIDEQTRRSVETMCQCGLDFDGIKACFSKIDEAILKEIYATAKKRDDESYGDEDIRISCNCS